jgi:hypothetical protein
MDSQVTSPVIQPVAKGAVPIGDRAYAVISSQGCRRVAQGRTAGGSW